MRRIIGASIAAVLLLAVSGMSAPPVASVTSSSPLGTAAAGKSEVSIGDLITDAMRSALSADAAFVTADELKERETQIPAGKVTAADVAPYIRYADDTIVIVELTGKQLKQAMERSVTIYPQKYPGFLQVSGLTVVFDPSQSPGARVKSVLTSDGKPVAEGDKVKVAMTSTLANGALGYWKIWSKDAIRAPSRGSTVKHAVEIFFSTRTTIDYSALKRITVGQ